MASKKETPMTFSEKLRFLTAGKSRSKINESAGLEPHALNQYISKNYMPRPEKLLRLARVLGVSMEWLCDPSRGIVVPEDARSTAA